MGATVGTRLMIWWKGEFVGDDEFDNRYFKEKKGRRRWVIYAGEPEASAIPADWHAWLHHTVGEPPIGEHAPKRPIFDAPHQPNLTGTSGAYYPAGSLMGAGQRPDATGDYEAWKPE